MSSPGRRRLCAALATGLALPLIAGRGMAQARDTALPVPASLPDAARVAEARGEPMILLVSLPGCPYCELVRRHYLLPGRREAGWHAWQLDVTDRSTALTGFDQQRTTAAAQVQAWKAGFTPTVLFLGQQGQELAERLIGVAVPDFYGAYLDARLATARRRLLVS